MPIEGKLGAVYRTTGAASVAFTDQATTKNANYTRYKITDQTKRFWDDTAALTVKKNGSAITTGFTVEYAGGELVFDPANIVTDVITVSGKSFAVEQCAGMFEWKLDLQVDMKKCTTFASQGWAEQVPITKSWSASANGYWADRSFAGLLGARIAVSLFLDTVTNKRYEGYMYLKKNSVTQPAEDIVKETIDIEGSGMLYYHE